MAKSKAPRVDWETLARTQLHPMKIRIIELYATGAELAPVDLQRELDEPKIGNISYHVRALLNAELIELVRTEQRRGALAHFYRASSTLLA